MSHTSLEKQLKKLTVPQTTILSLGYKKTSLLIQPQDIGNHDLIAFFEVGIKGLNELCSINPKFEKFEKTLFSQSWQSKQRAILSLSENKKIDLLIEEFLCLLSPYFNSKPALYALEWLVHRFNIEQYNTDALIGFSLPFMTTQVFTRLVQVIPLQNNPEVARNWWWLAKSKKTGVQINENSFISEAVDDTKLLKLICSFIIKIVNEHENSDELITVWTNFYAKIAVAAFKLSTLSKNNLVTVFLPSIIAGLESEVKSFTISAFIVIGIMSTYITYTEKLRSSLVKKILLVKHQQLWQNCTLLLCVIYNSTKDMMSVKLTNSCIKYLANNHEVHIDALKKVLNNDNNVFYLLLVRESIALAKNDPSLQSFCFDLVKLIDLNNGDFITELVKVVLQSVIKEPWYVDLVKILKTKYNIEWENTIKSIEFLKYQDLNTPTAFNVEEIATNIITNGDMMDVDNIINDSNSKKKKKKNSLLSKQYSSVYDRIQVYCENIWSGNIKVKHLCDILQPLILKSEPSIIALSSNNIVIPTLLCCLTLEDQHVRKSVIICLKEINKNYKNKNFESYYWVVKQIIDKRHEILVDNDQIRLVLMISLQSKIEDSIKILNILFETACNSDISCELRLKMFDLLSTVNTPEVCTNVLLHGLELLQNSKLNIAESHIIKFILDKLHPNFIEWEKMWHVCEKYLAEINPKLDFGNGELNSPVNIFVQNLTSDIFNSMSDDLKLNLIKILLDMQARVEDNHIIDSVKSFIHEVSFDSILFISHLEKMSLDTFDSIKWKNGIALLELIQNKNSLGNVTQLVPVLFDILNTCLKFEDQSSLLEYTKQLCLSCILNCCLLMKNDVDKLKVSEKLNLELIVSVMRSSLNQQTQHHALILLSNCAQMVPDQIILHVMTIFTFMGSSVMRQDDEYTFNITCQVLNTIIPILLKEGQLVTRKALSVFARSALDIPEHRRSTLLKFLVQALNTNSYLWELIVLVHKEYLIGTVVVKNRVLSNTICLDICSDCPINVMLDTCNNLLNYCKFLELKKGDADQTTLIDISNYSENKIYKLKYCLISFLTNLLSSYMFVSKVMYCTSDMTLKNGFTEMIKNTLWFIQNQNCISSKNFTPIKYYTILDKINALLPLDIFVDAINYILKFVNLKSIQHRTMDLLNKRLLETKSLSQQQSLKLLEPLSMIVNMSCFTVRDDFIVKQTALISITLITKCSDVNDNLEIFQGILQKVTKSVQDTSVGPLLGTYVLCIAELVSSLKTKAITCFSLIIPTVISVLHKLNEHCIMADGALLPSILSGLLRIISELKNFLSPYIVKLMYELALLSGTCNNNSSIGNENYKSIIRTKFQLLGEKISEIPNRVLEPALNNTLIDIVKYQQFSAFQYLLNIAKNSFNNTMTEEFTVFLLKSLEFCCVTNDNTKENIILVESSVITTITEIALKCSESTFRTFYHKLYEWKNNLNNDKCVMIYFRLLNALSSELKGLFLLFAGNIIPTANSILIKSDLFDGKNLLIKYIVSTLSNVFKYDTVNFVTKERFEVIMNPLVDLLESTNLDNHSDICLNHVIPCISNLIAAVTDDTLWKEINCQILLKARHRLPEVRSLCIDATLAIAERLRENFLPLLPDSIPFLAELMEDEQEEIEQKTRKAIQQMEKYVNEPIESYFC